MQRIKIKQIMQDNFFRKKVESLFNRMRILRQWSQAKNTTEQESYTLELHREILQISKHIIFMLDIIKREEIRLGLAKKEEIKK